MMMVRDYHPSMNSKTALWTCTGLIELHSRMFARGTSFRMMALFPRVKLKQTLSALVVPVL
jgi:hypothetical protein